MTSVERVYTKEEALKASLEYFNGDELAADVFVNKYALRDLSNNYHELTPNDMHHRLAKEFARVEAKYPNPMSEEEIYALFKDWTVVPQGSPLSGIGNPFQVQSLANCYTIASPEDSLGGIFLADQEMAQIYRRRGGVGLDISNLRPAGMSVSNAARTTSGIAGFMEKYSNTTRGVGQESRRGALIITISIHHPEIRTFINIKRDLKKVTGANISIRLTDEFLQAVEHNEDYQLRWPTEGPPPKYTEMVSAKAIWDEIVDSAWTMAEPGLLFWDTTKRMTPSDIYEDFQSISVNPCSEIVLSKYDSCRLIIINLWNFVVDPFTTKARFDFERFGAVARKAQKLMDDLVDLDLEAIDRILHKVENDPEHPETKRIEKNLWLKIKDVAINGRRTGLGITGLGDAIAGVNKVYGQEDSLAFTSQVYGVLANSAYASSIQMAKDRGPFPAFSYEKEKNHPFLRKVIPPECREDWALYGRRNIALTTTAPVGSISTLTQTTSGLEPAFMLTYTRRRKVNPGDSSVKVNFIDDLGDKWQEYKVYHHHFYSWMQVTGKTEANIEESPYWGGTSNSLDWVKSVELLGEAAKWLCHSASKTVNMPSDIPKQTVADAYMMAWKSGCKGVTVYRDGSRSGVLISNTDTSKPTTPPESLKRPEVLPCDIHRTRIEGKPYLVIVGLKDGKPYEVFSGLASEVVLPSSITQGTIIKNKKNKDSIATYDLQCNYKGELFTVKDIVDQFDNPLYGAHTRTISAAIRFGAPIDHLVKQLKRDKGSNITSFSSAIARVLSKHYTKDSNSKEQCPTCRTASLSFQEGCLTCMNCGYSKCG